MITISGYTLTDTIYEGLRSIVYRGRRERDNQPIVIKTHNTDYPSPTEITRYRHEYEVGRIFDCPGIIKYFTPAKYRNHEVLVIEDFGAVALTDFIAPGGIELTQFLQIAVQLAEALAAIHKQDIIHKDIKPRNVLINPATDTVKIIDFGISSQLSRENQPVLNPSTLEGTLAYISPEQTGRMNRAIDYRTDFYSLGVTFYELLTGTLPFQATDPLEMVHAHIAKMPTPPHELRPDIPQAIADIVWKLLAKTAEDRYHSAFGLKADLQVCLDQWQADKKIEYITPGQNDLFDRFEIPQKLYGREAEINTLVAAFDRVSESGLNEMMLVTGLSGIGKSALIHEIHKPLVRERGYFITGKFDQFQRNIPYRAIIQAFQELIRQLLTESEDKIRKWQAGLLDALGPNGQVITKVIPEVELIIGKQPPVPELGPEEAENRFNLVFQNFVGVFTNKEHPLVIFLDDLQWSDSASLNLIRLFMTNRDSQYLYLMAAYRDDEVGPGHALVLTQDEIKGAGAIVSHIALAPLAIDHITHLIADTLSCSPQQVQSLGELVSKKTDGNPFFIIQFLTTLYEEELIIFDYEQGNWHWDIEQIQAVGITDNVIELMANKIQKLPVQTQQVLQLAACIGNRFDLGTLSTVHEKTPHETFKNLWTAIQEGLIQPVDKWTIGLLEGEGLESGVDVITLLSARFLHDRVQQAAYSLIPAGQERDIHYKVGQLLLMNTAENEREEKIFDIVNQLNFGVDLVAGQDERDELAQLNLIAGRKAKASAAYESALNYFLTGMKLAAKSDDWQTNYELTLSLHVEAAETAYLTTDFEKMESLVGIVLDQAKTLLDKVKVYEIRIQAYMAQNKMLEAVETGRQVLKLLGVSLPPKPNQLHTIIGLLRTKLTLGRKNIEDLKTLPEMTDPSKLAAMRILMSSASAAYIASPELFPLVVFNMVNLSVKHGNASLSAFGYVTYGLILSGALGNINSGYEFGKFALSLQDRFEAKELKAKLITAFNALIQHWKEPGKATLGPLLEGYQSGLETGDLEYAANCAMMYGYNALASGQELEWLEQEVTKYTRTMEKFKQDRPLRSNRLRRQVILNLMGQAESPERLTGESFDEETTLPILIAENDRTEICVVHIYKAMLSYLFGNYSQALADARVAEEHLEAVIGQMMVPVHNLYYSLALLALYPYASASEQKQYLKKVASNQKKMKKWADHGPANCLHKYHLVQAERARVRGQDMKAIDGYSRAVESARENEFLHEEALASELAARFYLTKGMKSVARAYIFDAHYGYLRWGAEAKVIDLETKFPELLTGTTFQATTLSPDYTETALSHTTPKSSLEALDLQTVMKAAQAISGEIVLKTLLEKLMRFVIENAGAQKGYLILENEGNLVIEAEGALDSTEVTVLQSIPVETVAETSLSLAIINYVARTRQDVVLNNAAREGQFTHDPYISTHQPNSILCTPLINQGKLTGILYLENNLTIGAFTANRLELLKVLSAQIAISVENARLYTNLEESEKKYRTIFEDSMDTIFVTSPEGKIIDLNPAGLDLFGYSTDEVKHLNAEEVYANRDDRFRFREVIERHGSIKDFEVKLHNKAGTEIDTLVTATVRRTDDGRVIGYQGIIHDITEQKRAEKERAQLLTIQRELDVARDIQASLLPAKHPDWSGLEVICFSAPAREVGGDFYAYHAYDEGGFALAVGDVSGKGMPAALLMAVSLASFQTIIPQALRPSELLTSLDRVILRYTRGSRQNCALCCVDVSPPISQPEGGADRILSVANAGCIPPLIRRTDGTVQWAEAIGLPLGVGLDYDLGYDEVNFTLAKDDLVIMTSDGVVEATNAVGKLFSFERLEHAVATGPQTSAEAMLAHLQSEINAFVGHIEPHDDLTIVVFQI